MRKVIFATVFAATLGCIGGATAQSYPSRSITLVVPIAPGGAIDTAARIFAEKLQERLQQPVVVENRTGAGAVIGTASAAKAPADGYTLLLMEISSVLAKWVNKTVPFNVISDFTPIAMIATTPPVLFAHPSVPANDIATGPNFTPTFPFQWLSSTVSVNSAPGMQGATRSTSKIVR